MRDHAGGFVDYDHVVVFIDDRNADRFSFYDKRRSRLHVALDRIARSEQMAAFYRSAVYAQRSSCRSFCYERTGYAGAVRDDEVGALAGVFRRGGESQDLRGSAE